MITNNHDSHLSWYDVDDMVTTDQAKSLLSQLREGCDLCHWDLDSTGSACSLVVDVSRASKEKSNLESCPSHAQLKDFASSLVRGNERVEIALHVASCSACNETLFEQGLVSQVEREIKQHANESADRGFRTLMLRDKDQANHSLVFLNSQGEVIDTLPYIFHDDDSQREAKISATTLQMLLEEDSWTFQIRTKSSSNVVADLTSKHKVGSGEELEPPAYQVMKSIHKHHSREGNIYEEFAIAASNINEPEGSTFASFSVQSSDGKVWEFEPDKDGLTLWISVKDVE